MIQQPIIAPDALGAASHLVGELTRLRPQVLDALEYTRGSHALDDIVVMVLQGRVRMWTTPHSFLLVEKVAYPRQTHYHVFLAGGRLDELVLLHPEVIEAARADGATKLTLTGRRGWVRALLGHGWREVMTTVELEFEP